MGEAVAGNIILFCRFSTIRYTASKFRLALLQKKRQPKLPLKTVRYWLGTDCVPPPVRNSHPP